MDDLLDHLATRLDNLLEHLATKLANRTVAYLEQSGWLTSMVCKVTYDEDTETLNIEPEELLDWQTWTSEGYDECAHSAWEERWERANHGDPLPSFLPVSSKLAALWLADKDWRITAITRTDTQFTKTVRYPGNPVSYWVRSKFELKEFQAGSKKGGEDAETKQVAKGIIAGTSDLGGKDSAVDLIS